jgi:hypothetical protein
VGAGAGPTLFRDCKVHDNVAWNNEQDAAGGGFNIVAADPILQRCDIYDNEVWAREHAYGGGVNLLDSSAAIKDDCLIRHNSVLAQNANAYGGGVAIGQALAPVPVVPRILDSRIVSNTLEAQEAWGFGGGIGFAYNSWTLAVISDSIILSNTNLVGPGGACGGGIGLADGASADQIEDNILTENLALAHGSGARGGGICLHNENTITVTNNLLVGNDAKDPVVLGPGGGGVFANSVAAHFVNNTIAQNGTTGNGGGVYLLNGRLLNSVIVSNTADVDGGGVYWGGGTADYNDVWGNTCLAAGCGPEYAAGGFAAPPNDISLDPQFVATGSLARFYHLPPTSPCIDAGVGPGPFIPVNDFDDQPRPWGPAWDMGFDEVLPFYLYLPAILTAP